MSGELQLVNNDWWRKIVDKSHLESALSSNKIILLFEILKECERVGDKCVISSGFVEVLNVVEYFMQQINQQKHGSGKFGLEDFRGPWKKNEDYFRLDGNTPKERRHSMITRFNDAKNTRTKVFLISAKAGGLGINLFGANRLILLDTSWNPSTDRNFRSENLLFLKFSIVSNIHRAKHFPNLSYGSDETLLHLSIALNGHYGRENLFPFCHQTGNELSCR